MIKYLKKNKTIFILLTTFIIISLLSIYSYSNYTNINNLVLKQGIFYLVSIIIMYIIYKIKSKIIIKYSLAIYIINVILLILVLIFAKEVNGIKAWFDIPFIGSFQPSEFMKIGIILLGSKIIEKKEIKTFKDEMTLILKLFIIILIPSILTFLEPDTGSVIIYIVIFLALLYASNIKNKWFIIFSIIITILIGTIFYLYYWQEDLFINIFGSSLFYRLDRIFDFVNASGMQLENSKLSISGAGLFGYGILNIPIYYPEGQTDFIFTSFASTFGFLGALLLIALIIIFDIYFINKAKKENTIMRYIVFSFISVVIFQQIENISMTIGLLPIIGITLPFISYGGSSLLSFMILLGIILAKDKD